MNDNPCSNQEIHVLFEHGYKLKMHKMRPELFVRTALQTRLVISLVLLFVKTLRKTMML